MESYLISPHDTAIHFTSTHLILPQYTLLQLKTPHFTSTLLRSFHVNTFHLISPHLILPQHTFPYFPSTYCTISYVISTHPYTLHLILPQLTSHQTPYLIYLNTPYLISPQYTSLCLNTPSSSLCLETPHIATARHSYYRTSLFYLISYSTHHLTFDTLTCFSP